MSAAGFIDACGFIPASAGTGDFVVSAAVVGYQTPASAVAVNALVYSYRAESADKSQWEEGFGAYTVSTTTLARTTITANSSGGTGKITFSAAPNVYITVASADLQNASLLANGTVATARLGSGTASSTTALFGDQTYKSMATIATSGSASDLSGGTVPTARLGSGTASSTTALFGDQTYKTITVNGLVSSVPYTSTQTITIQSPRCKIRLWGGSGGGAGGAGGGTVSTGGGGAGYLEKTLTGLTAGNTLALTIGAAGSAGGGSTNGGNGGNSSLASGSQTITTLTANGGGLGHANSSTQGTGGTAANGDWNITGQSGAGGDSTDNINGTGGMSGGGRSVGGNAGNGTGAGSAGIIGGCDIEWFS